LTENRSAALLVRVWLEAGPDDLRARLTALGPQPSGAAGDVTVAVTASRRELLDAISDWLDQFLESRTATD